MTKRGWPPKLLLIIKLTIGETQMKNGCSTKEPGAGAPEHKDWTKRVGA